MEPNQILYPLMAMMALSFVAFLRLAWLRFGCYLRGRVPGRYYVAFRGEAPEAMEVAERHVRHHFEVPVLFYALGLTAYVTGMVSMTLVALAWAFVASRVVHTVIHLTFNHPLWRFGFFLAGFFLVVAMWGMLLAALIA